MPFRPRTRRNRSNLLVNYVKEVTEPDNLTDGSTLIDGTKFFRCGMEGCVQDKDHVKDYLARCGISSCSKQFKKNQKDA